MVTLDGTFLWAELSPEHLSENKRTPPLSSLAMVPSTNCLKLTIVLVKGKITNFPIVALHSQPSISSVGSSALLCFGSLEKSQVISDRLDIVWQSEPSASSKLPYSMIWCYSCLVNLENRSRNISIHPRNYFPTVAQILAFWLISFTQPLVVAALALSWRWIKYHIVNLKYVTKLVLIGSCCSTLGRETFPLHGCQAMSRLWARSGISRIKWSRVLWVISKDTRVEGIGVPCMYSIRSKSLDQVISANLIPDKQSLSDYEQSARVITPKR